ncbi:FAD-dependent oxidoreductase [Humibacillus xanthopallidus]|uniref:FAD-dependent oxidoreductase n=1 Tax=Humibacillus xanthopallidus TaxID=412689 RepID=UPI00384F3D82
MTDTAAPPLPTLVIGAGPIGLAAAAHLLERGQDPLVVERGPHAATSVRAWGHVRLFSRWSELVDPAAARLLEPTGWTAPDGDGYPTGAEWAELYLQPLADALGDRVSYGSAVTGVARRGRDRVVDSGRSEQPFTVHLRSADGGERRLQARAVVDASGTFTTPNPLGSDGYPAAGERSESEHVSYLVPDIDDPADVARYGGRRTAVVGSGHSALTALVALAILAERVPGTTAVWVLRRGAVGSVFGGGDADELPARGALGVRAREAVAAGHIEVVTGFRTEALERRSGGGAGVDGAGDAGHPATSAPTLTLVSEDGRRIEGLDEVVGLTGFRPDHSVMSELRLGLDARLEAPLALAPLIDPNVHSCGTVYPHGAAELAHDEEGVFVVGMKSYGRAPTFLAMTGYEQVRSVAAALAGDDAAARRVELTLPETGVCGGAGLFDADDSLLAGSTDSAGGGCCAPAPALLQIGSPAREVPVPAQSCNA